MKFKKSEICDVLAILSAATDTVRPQHKYVKIKVDKEKATFVQFSTFGICIAEVHGESTGKNFTGTYSTILLNSHVRSIEDDDEFIILENNRLILPNAEYTFEPLMIELNDENSFLKNNSNASIQFSQTVNCVNFIDIAQNFASAQIRGMDCVLLTGDKIIASDRRISCIIKNSQELEYSFHIQINFIKILKSLKIDEFLIESCASGNLNYFRLNIKNVNFYVHKSTCAVEDYTIDKYKAKYEHSNYVIVDRLALQKALSRMSMVVSENPDTRIYLKVDGENFNVENRDHSKSKEKIKIKAKFGKFDVDLAVSCRIMIMLVNNCKSFGNEVFVYFPDKGGPPIIKLETEQHLSKFIQAGLIN